MPTEKYRSRNLYESGYLSIVGSIPDLERDEEGIIWFSFPAECEELAKAYWKGDTQIDAKSLADSIRTLKDRMSGTK